MSLSFTVKVFSPGEKEFVAHTHDLESAIKVALANSSYEDDAYVIFDPNDLVVKRGIIDYLKSEG